MSLRSRMRDVVTIKTPNPTTTDIYGDAVPAWDSETGIPAIVAQQSGTEDNIDRETRVSQYVLIVGNEVDIDATCEVVLADGTVCRVIGEPVVYPTTRGPHHIEARLESVVG